MNSQIKHNLFQPKTKSILQIENLVTFNNVRLMLHNPLDIRKHQNVPHFPYIFMFLGRGVPFIDYCSGVYGTSNLYSSGRCNTFFRGGRGGGVHRFTPFQLFTVAGYLHSIVINLKRYDCWIVTMSDDSFPVGFGKIKYTISILITWYVHMFCKSWSLTWS